jgi:hypothetical protein
MMMSMSMRIGVVSTSADCRKLKACSTLQRVYSHRPGLQIEQKEKKMNQVLLFDFGCLLSSYGITKTDPPRPPFLVGLHAHAALCQPAQGPAQSPLSLDQATHHDLGCIPDEPSPLCRTLPSASRQLLTLYNRHRPTKRPHGIRVSYTQAASL